MLYGEWVILCFKFLQDDVPNFGYPMLMRNVYISSR